MNSYILTRRWFDFAFVTGDAKAMHTALFCWIVELNNRLGWKPEFGLPTQDTMEGLSIGNKNTYLKVLRDLAAWKFIEIVKESKNQYQACVIKICYVKSDTAQGTALDTALIQHDIQHCYSTGHGIDDSIASSIDTIDKPINQETNKHLVVEVNNADAKKTTAEELEREWQLTQQATAEEEKEKSSAQKEKKAKPYPTLDEALSKIPQSAHWRNVIDHHKVTEAQRAEMFKIFYEMKEDNYRIRYPTITDMASNFYFWVKTYQVRETIQNINQNAVSYSKSNNTAGTKYNRTGNQDKRDGLKALRERSGQFLQAVNGNLSQEYPNG